MFLLFETNNNYFENGSYGNKRCVLQCMCACWEFLIGISFHGNYIGDTIEMK